PRSRAARQRVRTTVPQGGCSNTTTGTGADDLTVDNETDFERLRAVGRVCAIARDTMAAALSPGMSTAELDEIGRKVLVAHGARSAPALTYGFPGANFLHVHMANTNGISVHRHLHAG